MRDEIETLKHHAIRPFGVNPASIASHKRYVDQFAFPFPLLSDPEREVCRRYAALKDDGRRIQRSVYLIDRTGTVRYGVRGSPPLAEVIEALRDDAV